MTMVYLQKRKMACNQAVLDKMVDEFVDKISETRYQEIL